MAAYRTRKQGTAARQQTTARRAARAVKYAGAASVTRAGHARRTR